MGRGCGSRLRSRRSQSIRSVNGKGRPNLWTGGLGLTRRPSSATKECPQLEDHSSSSALALVHLVPLRSRATASIGTCHSGSVSDSGSL